MEISSKQNSGVLSQKSYVSAVKSDVYAIKTNVAAPKSQIYAVKNNVKSPKLDFYKADKIYAQKSKVIADQTFNYNSNAYISSISTTCNCKVENMEIILNILSSCNFINDIKFINSKKKSIIEIMKSFYKIGENSGGIICHNYPELLEINTHDFFVMMFNEFDNIETKKLNLPIVLSIGNNTIANNKCNYLVNIDIHNDLAELNSAIEDQLKSKWTEWPRNLILLISKEYQVGIDGVHERLYLGNISSESNEVESSQYDNGFELINTTHLGNSQIADRKVAYKLIECVKFQICSYCDSNYQRILLYEKIDNLLEYFD